MSLAYKLYWSDAKRVWLGKWKDPVTTLWRNKSVPCELTHEQDAAEWFGQWWATNRLDKGAPEPQVRLTMGQVFEWWIGYLKNEKPGADADAWRNADRVHRLWVQPHPFARVFSDQLSLAHCVDWIEAVQRQAKADYTARNVIQVVRTFLSDARGKGRYSGENFFNDPYVKQRTKGAEPSAGKETIIHLSEADARRVAYYQGDGVPIRRHTRHVLALLTGLRTGEIAALRWCDVSLDVEIPVVRVHRQLARDPSTRRRGSAQLAPFFKPPKRKSHRVVPLHRLVVLALRKWRLACPQAGDDTPIFAGDRGGYTNDFRTDDLVLDLKAYGVPHLYQDKWPITPHAFRRTCLTLLTDADVPDADVKAIAGHAKAGVTRQRYVERYLPPLYQAIGRLLPPPKQKGKRAA